MRGLDLRVLTLVVGGALSIAPQLFAAPSEHDCPQARSRVISVLQAEIDPLLESHARGRFSVEQVSESRLAAMKEASELASFCAIGASYANPPTPLGTSPLYEAATRLHRIRSTLDGLRAPTCDKGCIDGLMGMVNSEREHLAKALGSKGAN